MDLLERIAYSLAKKLYGIAGAAIVVMMVLTCADILLRLGVTVAHEYGWSALAFFKPIPGTYELVCFLGAVAVSFAMAHTSVEKGHVAVSLLVRLLPKRTQSIISIVTECFGLILFAALTWRSVLYGNDLQASGEVSMTLELPFYPFVYGVAFSAMAVCLVLVVDIYKNFKRVRGE